MTRITILMPVYNGELFLKEAIDSVLEQSYQDFIFLIINDGSTDRTEQIIKSYDDVRIIYHKNEINLGLVATLNNGIEMVETEFLARMDADDLWDKTKLEKQINLLDTRLDVGICGTSIRKFGKIEGDFIFPVTNEFLKAGFLFYCMMSHSSVIFRMSFLKKSKLRYQSDFFPAEDYKMWIDALDLTQIYNFQEILAFYRQHEEQITQGTNIKQLIKADEVKLEMLEKICPTITQDEKEFHLSVFSKLQFKSVSDYKKSMKWAKKIISANDKTNYIESLILEKELYRYIQVGYNSYVIKTYFPEMTLKNWLKYIISFDWMYLRLKKNAKLVIQCVIKR